MSISALQSTHNDNEKRIAVRRVYQAMGFQPACFPEMHDRMINHEPNQERKVRGGEGREEGMRKRG